MKGPVVSIITPSYNQGKYIEQTIQSVLNQTYPCIEYIVLDAMSADNTRDILDKYENHPRVAKIIRKKDKGQTDAIEMGFKMASGEIIGWINSDDVLAEDVVGRSVEYFRKDVGVGLTYGDIVFIDEQGRTTKIKKPHPSITKDYLLNINYDVYQQGSFYRKSVVESAGYLNQGLYYCMDLDLWLRILRTHQARYIDGPAGLFRWHESTKTANGGLSFLREIHRTLNCHNARYLPETRRRLLWYSLKVFVKSAVTRAAR